MRRLRASAGSTSRKSQLARLLARSGALTTCAWKTGDPNKAYVEPLIKKIGHGSFPVSRSRRTSSLNCAFRRPFDVPPCAAWAVR